ncbi:Fic family protein [Pseudomonadota bacterium]
MFGDPLPEFIGARPDDLETLMNELVAANDRMHDTALDPVLHAAATAFGFVYIHPFDDGNGRIHRCLIHHVLAQRKFTPPGIVFPVSSVMLDRIDGYRAVLQDYSGPLMEYVSWQKTPERNVHVTNDTGDLYRYFDCTEEAEFLYECVARTVEHDLPEEIEHLRRHDEMQRQIMETIEMPDRLSKDLIMFIRQNDGKLPTKRREKEFAALTDDEVLQVEAMYEEIFADPKD